MHLLFSEGMGVVGLCVQGVVQDYSLKAKRSFGVEGAQCNQDPESMLQSLEELAQKWQEDKKDWEGSMTMLPIL